MHIIQDFEDYFESFVNFCIRHYNIIYVYIGEPFQVSNGVKILPTPGHTADDISVVVETRDLGTVVIAGK